MSRSFLFVPGDSERKMEKAGSVGADALILDLEDAVAPDAKAAARGLTAEYVRDRDDAWVRINPVDTEHWEADLEAVIPSAPAGIVLPKARHAHDATPASSATMLASVAASLAMAGRCPASRRLKANASSKAAGPESAIRGKVFCMSISTSTVDGQAHSSRILVY